MISFAFLRTYRPVGFVPRKAVDPGGRLSTRGGVYTGVVHHDGWYSLLASGSGLGATPSTGGGLITSEPGAYSPVRRICGPPLPSVKVAELPLVESAPPFARVQAESM